MVDNEEVQSVAPTGKSLKTRAILGAVAIGALLLTWVIGVAVIPRWWAHRIGSIVDGSLTFGGFLGVVFGILFTIGPMLVLLLGWRMRHGWKRAVGFIVAAALLAGPNLATLGIVLGTGNSAHAGERTLDVEAPGFRGGTLVGAILGLLLGAALVFVVSSRGRNKRKADRLSDELKERR